MKHIDLSTESGEAVPQFLDDRLDLFRTAFTEPTWRQGAIPIWRIFSYRKLLSRIEDLCPG